MAALVPQRPLEVEPGVLLADLDSVEACDAAFDRLNISIASIERQLEIVAPASVNQPADWRLRAKGALRIRKMLKPLVQQRRGEIARQERQERHRAVYQPDAVEAAGRKRRILIGIGWEHEPDAMRRIEAIAREAYPDLFAAAGEEA